MTWKQNGFLFWVNFQRLYAFFYLFISEQSLRLMVCLWGVASHLGGLSLCCRGGIPNYKTKTGAGVVEINEQKSFDLWRLPWYVSSLMETCRRLSSFPTTSFLPELLWKLAAIRVARALISTPDHNSDLTEKQSPQLWHLGNRRCTILYKDISSHCSKQPFIVTFWFPKGVILELKM